MKIWTNTSTLDDFNSGLDFTENKSEAYVALLGSKPISLSEFPNLKGLFRAGVGKDNVPELEAQERGIKVKYPSEETQSIIFGETANFAIHLILKMMYKNIGEIGSWTKSKRIELNQKKVLLIGQGNIGKLVKEKLTGFTQVITYDVLSNSPEELKGFLQEADCISIHIPNSKENDYFIDKKKLALLKDGAVLINTARGQIVNEEDLLNEIKKKRIFAAFDVFWEEPYFGKLADYHPDQFYMTPHVASTCQGFLEGCRKDLDLLIKEIHDE